METIPLWRLAFSLVPVAGLLFVLWSWGLKIQTSLVAVIRMLLQLLLVGYVLATLFESKSSPIVLAALFMMTIAASWISLRTIPHLRSALIWRALIAISVCGLSTLFLVTSCVLNLSPWFMPSKLIPLGGMVLASCMNTVSLAAERFQSELDENRAVEQARQTAIQTALIPITNSLLAVGLVSFPGMMTGQVLSGVSPLIAVRYQIVVMCMTFGGSGLAAVTYLWLVQQKTDASLRQP